MCGVPPLQTDGLNVCKIGFLLGPAIPDVLHRVGIKKSFPILDTEILEIGWTLLKSNTGAILIFGRLHLLLPALTGKSPSSTYIITISSADAL